MGIFSKKSTTVEDYINSPTAQRALAQSRAATKAGAEERAAIRREEREERAAIREEARQERLQREREEREAEAKLAGQKAYEAVLNGEEAPPAPTRPARRTPTQNTFVVKAPRSSTDAFPWLEVGLAGLAGLTTVALAGDGSVVDDSAAREKADVIDAQATAALDEVTGSMFGNASWSAYPSLGALFRTIDTTNSWRSSRDECEERDSDEFSECLRTALEGEGITEGISTRLMAKVSSLHHLYGEWSSTSPMFR